MTTPYPVKADTQLILRIRPSERELSVVIGYTLRTAEPKGKLS